MNHQQPEGHLPIDPVSGKALPPRQQPGYYPGFSTLSQQSFWDAATRRKILTRVEQIPELRFFTGDEVPLARAIFDRLMPQDDRTPNRRIPVVNYVDDRLWSNIIDGYRFEDMPEDREAYRIGLQGIEAVAQHLYQRHFAELGPRDQDSVLLTLHDDDPPAGEEYWKRVPGDRFWLMMLQDAVDAYYSHPWSWDEVGFGGPAYPRGYFRLENGQPEPWEVREQRYEWDAPPDSLSGEDRPLGGRHQHAGQEGTH